MAALAGRRAIARGGLPVYWEGGGAHGGRARVSRTHRLRQGAGDVCVRCRGSGRGDLPQADCCRVSGLMSRCREQRRSCGRADLYARGPIVGRGRRCASRAPRRPDRWLSRDRSAPIRLRRARWKGRIARSRAGIRSISACGTKTMRLIWRWRSTRRMASSTASRSPSLDPCSPTSVIVGSPARQEVTRHGGFLGPSTIESGLADPGRPRDAFQAKGEQPARAHSWKKACVSAASALVPNW